MKKLVLMGAALLIAGAVSASAAEAKEVWEKECAKCHGADGKGKTKMGEKLGVRDYTDPKVQEAMKDDQMAKAIKDGVKEKGSDKVKMKAFPDLSDAEIKSLVTYIRAMKK
jgi:cytochrome c553